MIDGDRTSSRTKASHLHHPTTMEDSRLNERAKSNRRIRPRRLLGDLFVSGAHHAEKGDLLGALRCYQNALRIDGDSYHAWIGLSVIFRNLQDTARAERCLHVARRLRRVPSVSRGATA